MNKSNLDVNLFFDESGKGDSYCLMGALLIPSQIYDLPNMKKLNEFMKEGSLKFNEYRSLEKKLKTLGEDIDGEIDSISEKMNSLKNEKFQLHFTDYDSNNFDRFVETIRVFSKYINHCEMNIINYFYPSDIGEKQKFKTMSYRKFPERVFYGLLRNKGKFININAKIFIESASEYETVQLKENIINSLNDQAIYRGEKFKIKSCEYKNKGEEIGVELTDILLGVIRNIMLYLSGSNSKTLLKKLNLIDEFLKIDDFYIFLKNLTIYEWNKSSNLKEIQFDDYLRLYILKTRCNGQTININDYLINDTIFKPELK